uniref:Torso-like protein n=1 Tax=Oncopeltus fasciatus TaxID=7536 RepID=R4S9X9_ONCFA|nr:torso-like protein [Oncopeltus fasciatus]
MARITFSSTSDLQRRVFLMVKVIFLLLLIITDRTLSADNLDVGKSLNVFGRYAYFSISMKVVARNDSIKPWVFREPLVDVFQNLSGSVSCLKEPKSHIHAEFNLELCDNLDQLFQAYFREFVIEGMDESWRAFTSSWSVRTIAQNFGIDVRYVTSPRSYILVRAFRKRKCKTLINPLEGTTALPLTHVKALADKVTVGNKESVLKFIKTYGSHYIESYATGDSLYQVFVFHTPVFRRLKARLEPHGIDSFTKNDLNAIFSPWYAEQVGSVLSASGNMTITNWANKVFTSAAHLLPYTSLMKMYGDVQHFKELDNLLQNEALLSLKLKALSAIFEDPSKKIWFLEFLFNNMHLWEQNMYSFLGR